MRNRLFLILFLFSFRSLVADTEDWLLVPGERAGMVTKHSSLEDLKRKVGKNNLKEAKSYIAGQTEGEEGPITILYPSEPEKTAVVVWEDPKVKTKPRFVMVGWLENSIEGTKTTKWKTLDGVTLGTTIEQLQKLNGKAFLFMPFNSDVGGNIISWEGGKLSAYQSQLWVSLGEPSPRIQLSPKENKLLAQMPEFRSDLLPAQKLKPRVVSLRLEFR